MVCNMSALVLLIVGLVSGAVGYPYSDNDRSGATSGAWSYNGLGPSPAGAFPGAPPFPMPFEFQQLYNNYFSSLFKNLNMLQMSFADQQQYIQNNLAQAFASAGAGGYGFPGGYPAFQTYFGPGGAAAGGGAFTGAFPGPGGVGAAGATAFYGPGGIHQTATFTPAGGQPNIDTRFASSSPDGGQHFSVFTSSVSGATDVDGKQTGFRKAQTTVNDNGKVTTYTLQDPQ